MHRRVRLGWRAPFPSGNHSCSSQRNPSSGGKCRCCHFSSWRRKSKRWSQERSCRAWQLPVPDGRRGGESCELGRVLLCPSPGEGAGRAASTLCFSLQGSGGLWCPCGAAPELARGRVSVLGSPGVLRAARQQSCSVCCSPAVGHGGRGSARAGISSWALGMGGVLAPVLGDGHGAQGQRATASTATPGGTWG